MRWWLTLSSMAFMSMKLLLLAACLCDGVYDSEHRMASARLYGNVETHAYYFVDLLVGAPSQRASVILDTGSEVTAFPCAGCRHCGDHIDPIFDFNRSTTATWSKCGENCIGKCKAGYCSYKQSYQEGSSISGYYFSDVVHIGDAFQQNPSVRAVVGCHSNENQLFYSQKANGILGIGPNSKVVRDIFRDKHIDSGIFSVCLSDWGGGFVVGGRNSSYHTGPIINVSMNTSYGYYGVSLSSLRVLGKTVATDLESGTIIDSGTTRTYFPSHAYRGLRVAIEKHCHRRCHAKLRNGCWIMATNTSIDNFPTVQVVFHGAIAIDWPATAYLYKKRLNMEWCYAFEDDGKGSPTTLGASFMMHKDVIFDLGSNKIGIAKATCPSYRKRPYHKKLPLMDTTMVQVQASRRTTFVLGGASVAICLLAFLAFHNGYHKQLMNPESKPIQQPSRIGAASGGVGRATERERPQCSQELELVRPPANVDTSCQAGSK